MCVPAGDLLVGLVGGVCVCVPAAWRLASRSCRCDFVCVPAGDLLVGLVGGVCVCVPAGDLLVGLVGGVCVCP